MREGWPSQQRRENEVRSFEYYLKNRQFEPAMTFVLIKTPFNPQTGLPEEGYVRFLNVVFKKVQIEIGLRIYSKIIAFRCFHPTYHRKGLFVICFLRCVLCDNHIERQ